MKSPEPPVLVVGTTPDYVHWIDQAWPGRALFLTDSNVRRAASEPAPQPRDEILANLEDMDDCRQLVRDHLQHYNLRVNGLTCFDCEAMPLAAHLAATLTLPYPSAESVQICRDKLQSKRNWQAHGVPCNDAVIVSSAHEAAAFLQKAGGACVLKPLRGSGSEFVFHCQSPAEVARAYQEIREGLNRRRGNLLYRDAGQQILAEEFVPGPEFSCDFLINEQGVRIVRLAKKIPLRNGPFGTILGYIVPGDLPSGTTYGHIERILALAARSLRLTRAVCMVDFIIGPNGPVLLELAPRPGGHCLPQLIRHASGLDMLGLALDVAQGWHIDLPGRHAWTRHVGMRIYARQQGVLSHVDVRRVARDPRVIELNLTRRRGHVVVLPPFDYDSWSLGYLIFRPAPDRAIEAQCEDLMADVRVAMDEAA